jgi:hypothetical protein
VSATGTPLDGRVQQFVREQNPARHRVRGAVHLEAEDRGVVVELAFGSGVAGVRAGLDGGRGAGVARFAVRADRIARDEVGGR